MERRKNGYPKRLCNVDVTPHLGLIPSRTDLTSRNLLGEHQTMLLNNVLPALDNETTFAFWVLQLLSNRNLRNKVCENWCPGVASLSVWALLLLS